MSYLFRSFLTLNLKWCIAFYVAQLLSLWHELLWNGKRMSCLSSQKRIEGCILNHVLALDGLFMVNIWKVCLLDNVICRTTQPVIFFWSWPHHRCISSHLPHLCSGRCTVLRVNWIGLQKNESYLSPGASGERVGIALVQCGNAPYLGKSCCTLTWLIASASQTTSLRGGQQFR